LGMVTTQAW